MTGDLEKYYRTASRRYDMLRFDGDTEIRRHVDWFVNQRRWNDKSLLDVGCGTGRYSVEFANAGFAVTGLDHSGDQLSEARKKKICVTRGRAEELPFRSFTFDAVSFIMMLHQLDSKQTENALIEAVRVAKKGGNAWIKTCSHDDLSVRPFTDLFPGTLRINRRRYKPIEELIEMFLRQDLSLLRFETVIDRYELTGREIVSRTEARHNSTLFFLSDEEFELGLAGLRCQYDLDVTYQLSHQHTLLEFGLE